MIRYAVVLLFCCCVLGAWAQTTDRNYLLGKFNPQTDARFSQLKGEHASGDGVLRKEAYQAFVKMAYAANKEKVRLVIISSTRNFISQKRIWENKWNGKTIVEGKDLTTVKDPVARAKIILKVQLHAGKFTPSLGYRYGLQQP